MSLFSVIFILGIIFSSILIIINLIKSHDVVLEAIDVCCMILIIFVIALIISIFAKILVSMTFKNNGIIHEGSITSKSISTSVLGNSSYKFKVKCKVDCFPFYVYDYVKVEVDEETYKNYTVGDKFDTYNW